MAHRQIITGEKYGRLTVMYKKGVHRFPNGKTTTIWHCKCECGKEKDVYAQNLGKSVKSCGCLGDENRHKGIHNSSNTRLFRIWGNMKSRCYNPNRDAYKNYGGRGIKICDEWLGENGFVNFSKWALCNGYSDNLSIDRIDNNGNYTPQNCKWSTRKEQACNRRTNLRFLYNGRMYSLTELCEISNIPIDTLRARLKQYQYSVEDAISLPLNSKRKVEKE